MKVNGDVGVGGIWCKGETAVGGGILEGKDGCGRAMYRGETAVGRDWAGIETRPYLDYLPRKRGENPSWPWWDLPIARG